MESYKVADIKPDTIFTKDVFLDKLFLVCPEGCPLDEATLKTIQDWNFAELFSEGKTSIIATVKAQSVTSEKVISTKTEEVTDLLTNSADAKDSISSVLQKAVEQAKKSGEAKSTDKSRMGVVEEVYDQYLDYIRGIYTRYATHKEFNIPEINETIKELCEFIRDNTQFVLRVTPNLEARNNDFLVSHSMRSTVFAVAIGLQLKMPIQRLSELAVACVLHEIGMIRLPPHLYMNEKPLTLSERAQILTHPIISYNILKEAGFPTNVQIGVLDHHERENGTGYPRKIHSKNISLYAKIIAVACSYEAITAPRHFREERNQYDGMLEMLKNANHQYDDTILKALLFSISLYPISSYVYLSNGKIGQVVDVQAGDPKNPIVQVLGSKNPDGSAQRLQTNDKTIKIVRIMNKEEVATAIQALAKAGQL